MATLIDPPTNTTSPLSALAIGQWCTIAGYLGVFQVIDRRPTDALLVQYTDAAGNFGSPLLRALTQVVTPIPSPKSMTISWADVS
jgi:hypothetical protein